MRIKRLLISLGGGLFLAALPFLGGVASVSAAPPSCTTIATSPIATNTPLGKGYFCGPVTIDASSEPVTLSGFGTHFTYIVGGGPVVTVEGGYAVTIKDLTIENGDNTTTLTGGGIYNSDSGGLTLDSVVVKNNQVALGGGGGGIYTSTKLTVDQSQVLNNSTPINLGYAVGGGIFNAGASVTLSDSQVSGNTAQYTGGIFDQSSGTLTMTDSLVSGNYARASGGGIQIQPGGQLTLASSIVSENNCAGSSGGGIYNQGRANITDAKFDGGGVAVH